MEGFATKPAMFFKQVRGLLIMAMAIPNGSRAGEFVELKVCILPYEEVKLQKLQQYCSYYHTVTPLTHSYIHSLITLCA
ncbi:hypothetical protein DPMN_045515 [Dreissena polymorpha]|uniref:Uncharacterized protein n=1 Tax=Dreissena polymorpha TaxID=45954 RepID=A0A9D4D519_DREPO|nr:hypothetical protein DPMN_045515 [Dreissena polymorpha]